MIRQPPKLTQMKMGNQYQHAMKRSSNHDDNDDNSDSEN